MGLLDDAPFLPSGAHHIPIITRLNHKHFRTSRHQTSQFPRQVKSHCIAEYRQDTLYWQQSYNGVNSALRNASVLEDLPDVYTILQQGTMHYFHHGVVDKSNTQPGFAELKWHHYKQLRSPGTTDLHTLFQKWRHFTKFKHMEHLHIRWIREVKHQKIRQLTMDAQQAFDNHDSFKLYHAISRSCPKQKTKHPHLKGDDGCFLTPTEETATYVKFIADNWAGISTTRCSIHTP